MLIAAVGSNRIAPPIDPTAYDALVSNRVTSVARLLNWFAEQQDHFERLIPPGLDVLNQPGTPDVLVIDLDSKDLPSEFAKHLLGTTPVFRYSVPTYDVFVQETAEGTIEVRDGDGNVLYADPAPSGYAIPYEALFRQSQYPHHYIPELARYRLNARVTLLPLAYVEHYLFAKEQVEEAAKLFTEEDPPMQMMMSGSGDDVWISAMTRMTNGLRLSLDYTESYSGQVWSAYSYDARYCPITNSVGGSGGGSPPVPGTNDPPACTNCPISDCDIDVTNSFLGLERVWSLAYSNLLLTGATRTVWLDTRPMGLDSQTNPTHRFYGFGSNVDTDSDGLNDGHELFISHTDRENADTDGDGLPDGWEVQNGLNPNDAADASQLLPNTAVNYLTAYQLGLNLTGQYTVVTLGPSDVQIAYKARRATRAKFTGFPAFIQPTNGPPVYYLGIDGWDYGITRWIETDSQSGGLDYGMGFAASNEFSYAVVASNMQYVFSYGLSEDLIQIDEYDDWFAYEGSFYSTVWAYTSGVDTAGEWFGDRSAAVVWTSELNACWNIGNWTYWSNYYTTNITEYELNWPEPDPPLVNSRYASLTVQADRFELLKGFELHESRGTNAYYTEAFDWEVVWEMHTPYTTPMLETNAAGDLIGLAVSHPWSNQAWASQVVKNVGETACDSIFVWTNSLTTNASSRGLSLDEKTLDIEEVAYRFAKATQSNVIYRLQWLERFESTMTNGAGQVEEVHTVHFVGDGTTQYVGDPTWDAASNQTAYATLATNNAAPDFLLEVPLAERGNGLRVLNFLKVEITSPTETPVTNNNFTFNASNPGICNIPAVGTSGVSNENPTLEWMITAIAGSTLTSNPNPPIGRTNTFTFTTLPASNSQFGEKIITLTHPTSGGQATQIVQVFFRENSFNNPDGTVPNWYYYWKQTEANYGTHSWRAGSGTGITQFEGGQWKVFLKSANEATGAGTWDNADGIDLFAHVSRHEERHRLDMIALWGATSDRVLTNDLDDDYLPDHLEATLLPGRPYTNTMYATYQDTFNYGQDPLRDVEDYCLRRQAAWTNGAAVTSDWANPGQQSSE